MGSAWKNARFQVDRATSKGWTFLGGPCFSTQLVGGCHGTLWWHSQVIPGVSLPKKWSVTPQNHLFHKGCSQRLSTFGRPNFLFFLQHFAKTCKNNQKQLLDTFGGLPGGCQGTLRWHIQAHSVRQKWKLLLKRIFSQEALLHGPRLDGWIFSFPFHCEKRTAEPHNRLFHIGTSKGHFWAAWFSDLFAAFCKSMQQPSKTTLKILDTFGHIQAHPVRESWKLLLKLPVSHRMHRYMDHVRVVVFFSSLSIAKKRTAEPQNRLFHIGTSKGWNVFGWPDIFWEAAAEH